jgi:hypothetical protein
VALWDGLLIPLVLGSTLGLTIGCSPRSGHLTTHSSNAASTSRNAGNEPTATYRGPITQPSNDSGTGVIRAVPPPADVPSGSWSSAAANCGTGAAICDSSAPISVWLALATDSQAGNDNPDGSITPVMENSLVYVLVQTPVACRKNGPSGGPPTSVQIMSCISINYIDANTDSPLYATQTLASQTPAPH